MSSIDITNVSFLWSNVENGRGAVDRRSIIFVVPSWLGKNLITFQLFATYSDFAL